MLGASILLNSIISDSQQGAMFMSCDLQYFFLAKPMLQPEYIKIHIKNFRKILLKIKFDEQIHRWINIFINQKKECME